MDACKQLTACEEVKHVAVLAHIVLAFKAQLALRSRACFAATRDVIVESNGLGSD